MLVSYILLTMLNIFFILDVAKCTSDGDGSTTRDNWRSAEYTGCSGSNVGNISRAFGDTDIDDRNGLFDTDDLAWRVSSEINNVSDVESESEDSPVILKQGERLKTGKVEQVKVISCSSPGHVVGRPVVWEVHYYRMIEDLTGYCEVTSPTTRISVGTGVGVKIDNLGWIRATRESNLHHCHYQERL